ncbi:MAG: hypothetical protein WC397_04120 [Candidatus Paceibacterota bacterium]|jgi:hypothetical protein
MNLEKEPLKQNEGEQKPGSIDNSSGKEQIDSPELQIDRQTAEFLPEAERKISSEAKSLDISAEEVGTARKEQGLDAKLEEIRAKVGQLAEKTKKELNGTAEDQTSKPEVAKEKEKMDLFEKERLNVPEAIMEATSSQEYVVRFRSEDFDRLRKVLKNNGCEIEDIPEAKGDPNYKGVPFKIITADLYKIGPSEDLVFAVGSYSPLYRELMENDLVKTEFIVRNANEADPAELEGMEKQNEFYSRGKSEDGKTTIHKRGNYLVYEQDVPLMEQNEEGEQ